MRKLSDIFEVVGVVDDRASASANFCLPEYEYNAYDGIKWLTEDELFNIPGLQAVMIETPNLDLVPTALRCMERNLAIHMDKPGGDNLEQFARLRKGCEERNLPFQIGYVFRHNPAIQWCTRAIHNNWLGDIFEISVNMSHDYGCDRYHEYLGNFKGGIMFNLGDHLIDFIIAMMGRPEAITPILKSTAGVHDDMKNNCLTVLSIRTPLCPCGHVVLKSTD